MSSEIKMEASEFLEYIEETKAQSTVKLYKRGLVLFTEYYRKSLDQILEERQKDLLSPNPKQRKRFVREIEKYHAWLMKKKGYPLNSSTAYCDGILQLFRYFEMGVTIPSSSQVGKRTLTTKDFVPNVEQYRRMFKVANNLRDKVIMSLGKDLAWRIGDFTKISKDILPDLEQDTPIPFDLITQKEQVLAKSFISEESVDLLKQYLPSLSEDNPYIFPSRNGSKNHLDEDTINRALRRLAKKAKVVIPKRKRLRFHAFRKKFISTCANLSIDINIAKILVGKNVEPDMLTYLSEVEHRKAFLTVYEKLRLTEKPIRKTVSRSTSEIERELEDLKRLVHGIIALGGKDMVDKARKVAQIETMPYHAEEIEEEELLKEAGRKRIEAQKKLSKEQLEKYKRLIEENNNNNH